MYLFSNILDSGQIKAKLVAKAFFLVGTQRIAWGKRTFLIMCTLSSDSTYFTLPMTMKLPSVYQLMSDLGDLTNQ